MRENPWAMLAVLALASTASMAQNQGPRSDDRDARRPDRPQAGPPGPPGSWRPSARSPATLGPPYAGRRPPHRYLSGGAWRHSIRGPAFRYPPRFSYRAWATGAVLPPILLTPGCCS